jgi:hypothetical protein
MTGTNLKPWCFPTLWSHKLFAIASYILTYAGCLIFLKALAAETSLIFLAGYSPPFLHATVDLVINLNQPDPKACDIYILYILWYPKWHLSRSPLGPIFRRPCAVATCRSVPCSRLATSRHGKWSSRRHGWIVPWRHPKSHASYINTIQNLHLSMAGVIFWANVGF